MTMTRVLLFLLIVCSPTLVAAALMTVPRWVGALLKRLPERPADPLPQPTRPPIQQLAADLRRLIRLRGELSASAQLGTRAQRLWAVEAAISARAVEAAQSLEVPYDDPLAHGAVDRARLTRLLGDLAAAGLVLPARVPFTDDGRT